MAVLPPGLQAAAAAVYSAHVGGARGQEMGRLMLALGVALQALPPVAQRQLGYADRVFQDLTIPKGGFEFLATGITIAYRVVTEIPRRVWAYGTGAGVTVAAIQATGKHIQKMNTTNGTILNFAKNTVDGVDEYSQTLFAAGDTVLKQCGTNLGSVGTLMGRVVLTPVVPLVVGGAEGVVNLAVDSAGASTQAVFNNIANKTFTATTGAARNLHNAVAGTFFPAEVEVPAIQIPANKTSLASTITNDIFDEMQPILSTMNGMYDGTTEALGGLYNSTTERLGDMYTQTTAPFPEASTMFMTAGVAATVVGLGYAAYRNRKSIEKVVESVAGVITPAKPEITTNSDVNASIKTIDNVTESSVPKVEASELEKTPESISATISADEVTATGNEPTFSEKTQE